MWNSVIQAYAWIMMQDIPGRRRRRAFEARLRRVSFDPSEEADRAFMEVILYHLHEALKSLMEVAVRHQIAGAWTSLLLVQNEEHALEAARAARDAADARAVDRAGSRHEVLREEGETGLLLLEEWEEAYAASYRESLALAEAAEEAAYAYQLIERDELARAANSAARAMLAVRRAGGRFEDPHRVLEDLIATQKELDL